MKRLVLVVPIVVVLACGHDHDDGDHSHSSSSSGHTSQFASCQAIIDACHPKDVGEGPAHDCHDGAHAPTANEATCAADKAACLATCAGDAG